jgi:hypothetical protein
MKGSIRERSPGRRWASVDTSGLIRWQGVLRRWRRREGWSANALTAGHGAEK